MCDPMMDVSMCAIYSYYNDEDMEQLFQDLSQTGTLRRRTVRHLCLRGPGRFSVESVGGL